ncbi:MAG TPA: SDR family oxidoreductase [Terriglobales bacterium]|nr:SDR family oxidoreductase [Terriglobales bacterium]
MESLCHYFAVALARRRITVNAISPGWIEDSVLNTLPKEAQDKIRRWQEGDWSPMGRLGTPEDVGNAVALLCSDEAGWITGQTLAVDGGASLMESLMPLDLQGVTAEAAEDAYEGISERRRDCDVFAPRARRRALWVEASISLANIFAACINSRARATGTLMLSKYAAVRSGSLRTPTPTKSLIWYQAMGCSGLSSWSARNIASPSSNP